MGVKRGLALAAAVVAGTAGIGSGTYLLFRSHSARQLQKLPESDLFTAGQLAANQGDCRKAVEIYRALLQKDPRHSIALAFLAECQVKLNDIPGAIQSLQESLKIDDVPRQRKALARLYRQQGRSDLADETLKNLPPEPEQTSRPGVAPAAEATTDRKAVAPKPSPFPPRSPKARKAPVRKNSSARGS